MRSLGLNLAESCDRIAMTSTSFDQSLLGTLSTDINAAGRTYKNVTLGALRSLRSDIVGQEFMKLHSEVNFKTGGVERPLNITASGLALAKVNPLRLFNFLSSECHPIAILTRRRNAEDTKFTEKEVQKLQSRCH